MSHNTIHTLGVISIALAVLAVGATGRATPTRSQSSAQTAKGQSHPAKVIAHFNRILIKSMKAGKKAGFKKRYALVKPFIAHHFDFNYIAYTVLGTQWRKFNQARQKKFIKTFKRYITTTYAARFDSYSGEKFKLGRTQPYRQLKVVHTQLRTGKGKTHQFDYLMRQRGKHWTIVNVIADGVSNLSLKRSQYTQILSNKGFNSLIEHINQNTAKLKK